MFKPLITIEIHNCKVVKGGLQSLVPRELINDTFEMGHV